MRLSNFRQLLESDYPEESKELIKQLGIPINSSFEEIYGALSNNLNFRDNLATTIASFNVTVNSDGVPVNKTVFNLIEKQTVVEGVIAINAAGVTDPDLLPTGGIFIQFTKSQNTIIVKNIKGLQTGKNYNLKVLVI